MTGQPIGELSFAGTSTTPVLSVGDVWFKDGRSFVTVELGSAPTSPDSGRES